MEWIDLKNPSECRQAELLEVEEDRVIFNFDQSGGGIVLLPPEKLKEYRYLVGDITMLEQHSAVMELRIYNRTLQHGMRFLIGLLPGIKTRLCIDFSLLAGEMTQLPRHRGLLKYVVHGCRLDPEEVGRIELGIRKSFCDTRMEWSDFYLTNEEPEEGEIEPVPLLDVFGQWEGKNWPGKIQTEQEYHERLNAFCCLQPEEIPGRDRWGGDSKLHLQPGRGFFTTCKREDGRWYLVDPDGNAFFSMGINCINPGMEASVGTFAEESMKYPKENERILEECTQYLQGRRYSFDYPKYYLKKFYGDDWKEKWLLSADILMKLTGCNTVGNWSDECFRGGGRKKPYVIELSGYPATESFVYRDFPDVFSSEYEKNCEENAKELLPLCKDPWLIGYFVRNEPQFSNTPGLLIADEVFRNTWISESKKHCVSWLRERYRTIEALNRRWNSNFSAFCRLLELEACPSQIYSGAEEDMRLLSVQLMEQYVRVPAEACRRVDSNHLNLGFRWARIMDEMTVAGWRFCDVFSFNSYSFNPAEVMEKILSFGVDRPYLIGEFHFGALDRGLPSTGLKGVKNQKERASAYRYYLERAAAHPNGVGAHWFQYMDQSAVGRFDGENYQVGMVDICFQPYTETVEAARASSEVIYEVKEGRRKPYNRKPGIIPMIAF